MSSNRNILFSVVIPTYNRANILGKAIESILGQTYTNWELIIVDDGSTDNTREIVTNYDDNRIRYFYKENEERSIARNYGITKTRGDYVSFLDDDDYYLPRFFEEFQKKIIEENFPVAMIMCDEYTEDEEGKRKLNNLPKQLLDNPVRLLWEIQTSVRPFAIHKDILLKNKFKEDCPYGQDFHLVLRISIKYPFYYVSQGLSVNIIHKGSGTNSKFSGNYRKNAERSIYCIEDLINNHYDELIKYIPVKKLYDLHNHKVYGFASAAMKHKDFVFWWKLLKKISFRGSFNRTFYYMISLLGRMPYYMITANLFLLPLLKNIVLS